MHKTKLQFLLKLTVRLCWLAIGLGLAAPAGFAACQYTLTPGAVTFARARASGFVDVLTDDGCAWTAESQADWLTITAGAAGNGAGQVIFEVAENTGGTRYGTLVIAGQMVRIAQSQPIACVSAASYQTNSFASESLVTLFGKNLAKTTEVAAAQPLPTTLGGLQVRLRDAAGVERLAGLLLASPEQINFQIPPGTVVDRVGVTVRDAEQVLAAGAVQLKQVAPGLFTANANGRGAATGVALHVGADNAQRFEPLAFFDEAARQYHAAPLELGAPDERVFLVLFGTGMRYRAALGEVRVEVGGELAEVFYAGAQGAYAGLDQLNVLLPRTLAGRGTLDVKVTVSGVVANTVQVAVR